MKSSWGMGLGGFAVVAIAAGGTATLVLVRNHAEAREREERSTSIAQGPLVETSAVKGAPLMREVTVPGEVHALYESTLYAKVSGYLRLIHVDKGDRVKQNEVLGIVEAPEVEAQATSQRADLAVKRLTESRDALLLKQGLLSQQDLDQAAANVNISEASLKQLESLAGYQVIRAPFDGTITVRFADPGALLQAATASTSALPLVTIANMDRVRVQAFLAQSDALFVHEGDVATVWTEERADVKADAKVTRIAKELNAQTRTMLTEIEIDNAKTNFYPGSFVRVKLAIAMPASIAVASDALIETRGKFVVARVEGDHVKYVSVDVIDTNGIDSRVSGDVKVGDVIVRHPGDDVVDGTRVRTKSADNKP